MLSVAVDAVGSIYFFSPESEIGGEQRGISHGDHLGLFRRGLAVGGQLTPPDLSGHEAVLCRTAKHGPNLLRPLLADGGWSGGEMECCVCVGVAVVVRQRLYF